MLNQVIASVIRKMHKLGMSEDEAKKFASQCALITANIMTAVFVNIDARDVIKMMKSVEEELASKLDLINNLDTEQPN